MSSEVTSNPSELQMRKEVLMIVVSVLLLVALQPSVRIVPANAVPRTIFVDEHNVTGPWTGTLQHPYRNITDGLANVSNGDTIFVFNGTYRECLTVNISISLVGENRHSTIIDGNVSGTVVKVAANNVSISGFTIRNSGSYYMSCGIYLEQANNNSISHNVITGNYKGVLLVNSTENLLSDNDILGNLEGNYLTDSNDNALTSNRFSNNEFAIVLTNATNNLAFHNNFVNNNQSVSSTDAAVNFWDNGNEGNYWSDYNGRDADHDAIGDSPYFIDVNNKDNYPLTATFTGFALTYENETYNVLMICNSTIAWLQFNETVMMLDLNVTGASNTAGFCRATIPQSLVARPCVVLVDNNEVNATVLRTSSSTHTLLYFVYNHTEREIRILSRPYYELLQKYNALYEDYQELNSTHYQLQSDYRLLNETCQQLQRDCLELRGEYESLNQTYWQLRANNTQLQSQYDLLGQTYQRVLVKWIDLLEEYKNLSGRYESLTDKYASLEKEHESLNKTCQEALANCTSLNQICQQLQLDCSELRGEYESLNQTYWQLRANNTKLQNDYVSIQYSYDTLLARYDLLNSEYANTRLALLCVSALAIAITVTTASLTIKYHKKSKEQEKLVKKYKSELERVSILDIGRSKFEEDVERRGEKIQSFERKYGVTLRPRATLEDVIKSLDIKKRKEE